MTNYTLILDFLQKNRHLPISEYLEFVRMLKCGKQGIVGLFKIKDKQMPKFEVIFKMSQTLDYLTYHEFTIMQGLKNVAEYCPHFIRPYNILKTDVEPRFDRKKIETNPFDIFSKYPVNKELLLFEYVNKSSKFYNYIRTLNFPEHILYSIIKQVLLSVRIAQIEKNFTHYDLHSDNIMIKKCDKNKILLYRIDEENQFAVPTYGYSAVIIDFGFSFCEDMNGCSLYTSLCQTNIGFMSDRFDKIADPKLFLITVSGEIKEERQSKASKVFRRVVRNIFAPLNIDLQSGWDRVDKHGALKYVYNQIVSCMSPNIHSILFTEYCYFVLDLFQSLIVLPLQNQNFADMSKPLNVFMEEWAKIENQISSSYYTLYILKQIIDTARDVRHLYMKKSSRDEALKRIHDATYSSIDKVAGFCNPKGINFDKMLCSLYLLSKNIEGILYTIITKRASEKEIEYSKLEVYNIEQIYAIICANITSDFVFTPNHYLEVVDNVNKSNYTMVLNDETAEALNELDEIEWGQFLNFTFGGFKEQN